MNTLLLDTSSKNCSIAVARDGGVVTSSYAAVQKSLNKVLIPAIDEQLTQANITIDELDAIVIGRGPGGFTSLRVGMAVVKGLAYAKKIPLIGISSLDAIAMNVTDNREHVCVVTDARRQMVYSAVYRKQEDLFINTRAYDLSMIEDVLKDLPDNCLVVGDGVALYGPVIEADGYAMTDDADICRPRAESFLPLIKERLEKKMFDDIDTLEPLYLYPEDCQVRR